jgi:hypothetical protein
LEGARLFRIPRARTASALREAMADQVEQEILEEKAASLTRAGRRVEAALAAVAAHDRGETPDANRSELLDEAARTVWALLIQRELCGFRDETWVVRQYEIPQAVMARVGRV